LCNSTVLQFKIAIKSRQYVILDRKNVHSFVYETIPFGFDKQILVVEGDSRQV